MAVPPSNLMDPQITQMAQISRFGFRAQRGEQSANLCNLRIAQSVLTLAATHP